MNAPAGSRRSLAFAFGEGLRNAAASRAMGLLLTLLSVLGFAGVATADAVTVGQLASDEAAWIAAGGEVLVASNRDGLPALACERLNDRAGVRAAVAVVRMSQRAALSSAPDASLTVVGVTGGIAGFLPVPPALDSALVTSRTAEQYGLSTGQWVGFRFEAASEQGAADNLAELAAMSSGDREALAGTRRVTVTELGLLGEEYASGVALLIPAGGLVDACIVWTQPGAKATLTEALPGTLPGGGDEPTVVADRLISGEFVRDYHAEYLARAWRWVPIPLGTGLGLVWILLRWVRRNEDGLYQSLGAARPHRALIRLTEWLTYGLVGAALALPLAIVAVGVLLPGAVQASPHIVRSIALGLAASVLVGSLAGLLPARNPLNALKDR